MKEKIDLDLDDSVSIAAHALQLSCEACMERA